jgi:hypothetical protein
MFFILVSEEGRGLSWTVKQLHSIKTNKNSIASFFWFDLLRALQEGVVGAK